MLSRTDLNMDVIEIWVFQIALVATVANLMLVATASGTASSAAWAFALLVGIASLGLRWVAAQPGPLQMAPSRPGF